MGIENALKELILEFTSYDEHQRSYKPLSRLEDRLILKRRFVDFINKKLLSEGYEKELIAKHYKSLSKQLHSDMVGNSPETQWLEKTLSEGSSSGICFILLSDSYQKYINPQKFKEIQFKDIQNRAELKAWLEHIQSQAKNYNQKLLYSSLIDLLDQATGYYDEVGKLKPVGFRALLTALPLIFSTYGTVLLGPQLFAIYAVYFFVLKGGQILEKNDNMELQKVGTALQSLTKITATATSIIIVRVLDMTFWFSHMLYDMTRQIGNSLKAEKIEGGKKTSQEGSDAALIRDLVIASSDTLSGKEFITPELKLVAAPLESYLTLNEQQYFSFWRKGLEKRCAVEQLLFQIQLIDVERLSLEDKLTKAKEEISKLQLNTGLNTYRTHDALKTAEQVADFLLKTDDNTHQVVLYKEPSVVNEYHF